MINKILSFFLGGKQGGATHAEIQDQMFRHKFSDNVLLNVYDEDTNTYHNNDGTVGWIWECTPLIGSSEKTLTTAESILRIPLPDYSVLQFLLHADPDIEPVIKDFKKIRKDSKDPLVREAVDQYCEFLRHCSAGIPQMSSIPLRNYRLIVTLKVMPDKEVDLREIESLVRETLCGIGLAPKHMEPPVLLNWLRRIFNDDVTDAKDSDGNDMSYCYNPQMAINKQIILAETKIDNLTQPYIKMGDRYLRSMSPKVYPPNVNPFQTKSLFGGVWGVSTDNDQYRTPFLYAFNIIYDNVKMHLQTKCDAVLKQEGAGAFARRLQRTQEEFKWAVDKMQQAEPFARIMPVMWFFGKTPAEVEDAFSRGKRLWEAEGYLMQEDRHIPWPMLIAALPMGCRASKNNLNMLERDVIVDATSILNLLPIQVDFTGCDEPVMIFQGRTGQMIPISIFSSMAKNFNAFIAAPPGAGKSFLANLIVFCHYTADVRIRIIDIGGSYKRQCDFFNGRYIDFEANSEVCLNPFTNIVDPDEDLASISQIILQMVYSGSDAPEITELENTLALDAAQHAWNTKGKDASMNDVRSFLEFYPKNGTNGKEVTDKIIETAHHMSFNMSEFTGEGRYSRYFAGPANFNIHEDKFVLLELDALKNNPSLFRVVTLLVLDAVSRDLYFSDRKTRRLILFDEAWQMLGKESGNQMMKNIIENGFRKARKYEGSFTVITQSILDRKNFGAIGEVVWGFADYKFLLQSEDYEKAHKENLIDVDQYSLGLMKSVQRAGTRFSEVYMQTPYGSGVGRVALNPFFYYMFTSNGREVAEMNDMVATGMTYPEAINEMVRKYRPAA